MKKAFQTFGLFVLATFSFFYTEKTINVVKEYDDIMIEIKEKADKYSYQPIDAIIKEDSIIPGIKGRTVNISKSYKKMRENGVYNENSYIYDYETPQITLNKNLDKYIVSGNPSKNMVSLIFYVEDNSDISTLIYILDKYNLKGTFFITNNYLNKYDALIKKISDNGHIIGNMGNNTNFLWINSVIKNILKQSISFCVYEEEIISNCRNEKNYIIKPISISNPLMDTKKNANKGSLLAYRINNTLNNELELIIKYINSKGYQITDLITHLSE